MDYNSAIKIYFMLFVLLRRNKGKGEQKAQNKTKGKNPQKDFLAPFLAIGQTLRLQGPWDFLWETVVRKIQWLIS